MRMLLMWEALILAASVHASAADFYEVMHSKGEPKYLVPVDGGWYEDEEQIAKYLFVTDGDFGRMVGKVSFEPEFCLSVHADIPKSSIEKHREQSLVPDEEKTYVMTLTLALESIWDSRASNNGQTNEIKVSRIDRTISLDLAVAIQRVWGKALQLTRYASGSHGGYDGATYQFSVWVRGLGIMQGETWTPQRGLPRELVNMGNDLIAFVRQDAKGKQMTEQELIKKLKKLESKIPEA